MQVIEKVKVVPEGYNGAGTGYDGVSRRDVNGKANAGLTLGIIGTALGAWALKTCNVIYGVVTLPNEPIVPFFIYLILIWTNLLM